METFVGVPATRKSFMCFFSRDRYYCEQCETCICVLCTFDGHSDHPVTSLMEGVQLQKAGFESMVGDCKRRSEVVRDQLRLIDGCRGGIQKAEDQIRDAAIEAIATVRRREAQLMSDLRRKVGEDAMVFVADRKSLEIQVRDKKTARRLDFVTTKRLSGL